MKTISKVIAVTLSTALISTSMLPVTSAYSHDKRKWHSHGHKKVVRHHRSNRSSRGDKIAAGVIGFAIGAILASEAAKNRQPVYTERRYVEPRYDDRRYVEPSYSSPRPIYREPVYTERRPIDDYESDTPRVITYNDEVANYSTEPWSQGWADYCRSKYRSFNINTGTFRGYDGKDHFCVVK